MKNNIEENSKRWLSFLGGIVAFIIAILNGIFINFLDPLGLITKNLSLGIAFYSIAVILLTPLTIWLWLLLKWLLLSLWGYIKIETSSNGLNHGIKIFSKKKIDLSSVSVELVHLSNLTVGNEYHLFVDKDNISSEIPLQTNLFIGEEDGLVLNFCDGKIPIKYMSNQEGDIYGDELNFTIKVFGKFDNSRYEFTEYYKGSFLYFFYHDMGTDKYESGQIRWTHKDKKRLKRTFKFFEKFRDFKRLFPSKMMLTRNRFVIGIAKFTRFVGFIAFKIKKIFSRD